VVAEVIADLRIGELRPLRRLPFRPATPPIAAPAAIPTGPAMEPSTAPVAAPALAPTPLAR
jgi:hypothetical protein